MQWLVCGIIIFILASSLGAYENACIVGDAMDVQVQYIVAARRESRISSWFTDAGSASHILPILATNKNA